MASTDAVTRPKPTEARNTVTVTPPTDGVAPARAPGWPVRARDVRRARGSRLQGSQRGRRDVADHVHLAGRTVGVDLEDAGRVVVAVEAGRAAGALVPDRLAGLERGGALVERIADGGAGDAVTDLDDVRPVHARVRALGHQHGQRGEVDPVVQVNAAGGAQVRGEVADGAGNLALLGEQCRLERPVGRPAGLGYQVVGVEVGRERARAD